MSLRGEKMILERRSCGQRWGEGDEGGGLRLCQAARGCVRGAPAGPDSGVAGD